MTATTSNPTSLGVFLRARPELLREWMMCRQLNLMMFCAVAIVFGAGAYGVVMGSWRGLGQALYTGIKLPLAILLTTLGNGLLNGMLAPLLGLNLTFRQSLTAVLISFAVASAVLGALSPVAWFVVWNTPPLTAAMQLSSPEYGVMQLTLAGFIPTGAASWAMPICCRSCRNGRVVCPQPGRFCLRGWWGTCFLAVKFAGCCGRLSGTRRGRWSLLDANIFTAVFLKLSLRRHAG